MLGIKHQYSSTYNPSSQGQVEQVNGTIKNLIKSFIVINDDTRFFRWIDVIDSLVFNYNNRVHSRTGFRPQYIQFGNPSTIDLEKVKIRIFENGISKLRNVNPKKMLKVGDKVRIALRALDKYRKDADLLKQTALRWTREIYTVKGIYKGKEDPEIVLPMYVIGNERGVLKNRFKFFDLQKIPEGVLQES
jgi:hypothetical protein